VFSSFRGCYHHRQRQFVECTCLKQLVDFDHTADFLVNVGMMKKGEQETVAKELILGRNATRGGANYSLRIGSDATMNYAFPVSRLTFLNLLHLGVSCWETLNTTKLIPGPSRHGNEGNSARVTSSALGASRESLILYLKETGERHREPHATRFIRMKAGMELREEEKGAIDLPSHFTKHKLYELWVWSRGWRVTSDNKGSYPPLAK
jgi:hypothetical protein